MSTQVTYHAKGVTLTDTGAEKVREFLSSQGLDQATAGLRVGVRGGGCSGFQYQLAFDEQRDGDAIFQFAGLRVGVRGGGCSGFQYLLAFDEQRDGDTVVTERGIKLLVDNASIPYVQGSTIDYVESLQGAGFQVNNPNVVAACGCGSSFRVAEEEEVSAL